MHRKPTGCIAQILGYTKSPYIAPFFFLVVETFRRNVSTKPERLYKAGTSLQSWNVSTKPERLYKVLQAPEKG